MKIVRRLVLAGVSVAMVGCAMARSPVTGFLYTDSKDAISATSEAAGSKKGKACSTSILGIVGTGDSSVSAAAKNGGISKVSSVDSSAFNVLGLYAEYCVMVSGS